ncbi:MAG: HAD family phosphatase [Odoribacteraceae bacterium]|jgi:HAD superfamily hydrolase (TIGR01509 family)|nr:HAD family phosphatase [Odoribacteraceae bacterium]
MTPITHITTALFDFDGVVADTEGQYARYFERLAAIYPPSVPDLAASVRGVTLPEILERFFGAYPADVRREIADGVRQFEQQMDYRFIPGAGEFIREVGARGYKRGLVTSSREEKMRVALERMGLRDAFDAVVTAERVSRGKPDPECYLRAADDLGARPDECVVFEDSIAGIAAGKRAGMRVVGMTTTLPPEEVRKHAPLLLRDFTGIDEALRLL